MLAHLRKPWFLLLNIQMRTWNKRMSLQPVAVLSIRSCGVSSVPYTKHSFPLPWGGYPICFAWGLTAVSVPRPLSVSRLTDGWWLASFSGNNSPVSIFPEALRRTGRIAAGPVESRTESVDRVASRHNLLGWLQKQFCPTFRPPLPCFSGACVMSRRTQETRGREEQLTRSRFEAVTSNKCIAPLM
jgi:hypothetical protein